MTPRSPGECNLSGSGCDSSQTKRTDGCLPGLESPTQAPLAASLTPKVTTNPPPLGAKPFGY
jgi:hypothetical protein